MKNIVFLFFFSLTLSLQAQFIPPEDTTTQKDTTRYADSANVIFKIYTGDNASFSRVVIQMESFPFREIKKQNDRIVVMLYNTVFGQEDMKMDSEVPLIKSVFVREMVKKHSQVIIMLDNPASTFRSFQLLRPCRLVIDIFPKDEEKEKTVSTYLDDLKKGRDLFLEEKYDKALPFLRKAAINGKMPEAYYYSAIIRFKKKDYPKATYNFTQALKREERFADSYVYLSRISADLKDYPKAVEYIDLYMTVSKDTSRFGEIREKRRYYQDIIDRIIKLEDLKEKQDSVKAAQGKPEIDSAEIDSFLTAHAVKESTGEEQPMTWFIWAKEYLEKEDYENAVNILVRLIDVHPESEFTDDAYLLLAKIYFKLSLYPQAKRYSLYLRSKKINKEFEDEYLFILSKARYFLNEWDEGREDLKTFIEKFPAHDSVYQAHLYLARIYERTKRPIKRDEEYELALKLVPDGPELLRLYDELGELFMKKEELHRAVVYFEKIFDIFGRSKNPDILNVSEVDHALFILGDIYYQMDDLNKAEEKYLLIERLYEREEPERLDWIYYQLGNISNGRKSYDEAEKYYNRVINDYPDSYWLDYSKEKLDHIRWLREVEPKIEELKKRRETDG